MSPKYKKPRYNTVLVFMLLILAPLYGGYYLFSNLLCGVCLIFLLLYNIHRTHGLILPIGVEAVCLYVLSLCHLASIPFSVNCGMAFIGFLRTLVWIVFFLCANFYSQEERQAMLDAVAWEGAILSMVFSILFVFNQILGNQDMNGRIDGPFQYANTWAVFQLICLIWLATRAKRTIANQIAVVVLLSGICLTGSRSVLALLFLLAIAGLSQYLKRNKPLRPLIQIVCGAVISFIISEFFSRGLLLERLLAIPYSSSLNGRLLYNLDGFQMLLKHPLGIGHGGYLYLQALEQTGVYTTKFVHNEFLQFAIDAGILAGVFAVGMVFSILLRPNLSLAERIVIFVITAHASVDFDFQFLIIIYLLLLCGAGGKTRFISFSRQKAYRLTGTTGTLLICCLAYFSAVYYLDFSGKLAWPWFPADLELAEKYLNSFSSPMEAEETAQKILDSTELSMVAWDCEYAVAALRGDTAKMVQTKYQYLRLNRYRGDVYADFTALLEKASASCGQAELSAYQNLAIAAIQQLEEVRERTSPLAYRIVDKPELDFAEAIIIRLKRIAEKE